MRWCGARLKPDEPQDRLWDATSPRAVGGESRRGGESPRGRNERVVGNGSPKVKRGETRASLGVDTGCDVDRGADLWKTLKEALGGTEPSRCEMRLRTRNVPDGRANVGPGNRDGERATAGKPVITSVNPYAGESRPALVKAHEPGTCRPQWMLEAPNTRATRHRLTARTNAGRHAGVARQLASRSSP